MFAMVPLFICYLYFRVDCLLFQIFVCLHRTDALHESHFLYFSEFLPFLFSHFSCFVCLLPSGVYLVQIVGLIS